MRIPRPSLSLRHSCPGILDLGEKAVNSLFVRFLQYFFPSAEVGTGNVMLLLVTRSNVYLMRMEMIASRV